MTVDRAASKVHREYVRLPLAGASGITEHHTHYRKAGAGPPVILLHPSPLSSAFMQPLAERMAQQATVYAPDTPGYGQSDALPMPAEDLQPYAGWLAAFMQELGLESAGIHGSATGAQIAIQFARAYPGKARFLMLENAVHFTDAEREEILANYFPDMTPREDGSHLQLAWKMAQGLFRQFPWYDDGREARVPGAEPSTALVHDTALAYLNSGVDYARAYRAAFRNEDARNLSAVSCPTRVICWQGSILRRFAGRLHDFEWPGHIRLVHAGPGIEDRHAAIHNSLKELLRLTDPL